MKSIVEELNKSLKTLGSIQIKKLSDTATLPTREHPSDAGLDIYASRGVSVPRLGTMVVPTDLAIMIPEGYEGTIRPRSGKTSKTPLRVQIGTIDAGYDGPIGVICDCHQSEPYYYITEGEKIAQLVISPIVTPEVDEVTDFNTNSERGSKGFGSSDKMHP